MTTRDSLYHRTHINWKQRDGKVLFANIKRQIAGTAIVIQETLCFVSIIIKDKQYHYIVYVLKSLISTAYNSYKYM